MDQPPKNPREHHSQHDPQYTKGAPGVYQGNNPPPSHPSPPPVYQGNQPPRKRNNYWLWGIVGVVAIGAICGISWFAMLNNAPKQQSNAPAYQPTATPMSTSTPELSPTATAPAGQVILFDKRDQTENLDMNNSPSFQASGKLHITYSCNQGANQGDAIQFNLSKANDDGSNASPVWSKTINCMNSGTEDVTVDQGDYKATVENNNNAAWNMEVTQVP